MALQSWTYAIYLQDEWKPVEPLTINVGTRFDLYDGLERADQASPRVGLEYTPVKGTTLHAAYARQFDAAANRAGSSHLDLKTSSSTTGAPASDGNRTPTVERDHLFDVGATQTILPGLNVGVDAYYKKGGRFDRRGSVRSGVIFETFNYTKGRVYGAERYRFVYSRQSLHLRQLCFQRRPRHPGRIGTIQLRAG